MFENAEIIMEGSWIYAGFKTCYLRIIKWDVLYGSSDYEDPPEIRDDREVVCYYVEYESITEKGRFNSGGGGYLSLSEAMQNAEKSIGQKVNWFKENL